MSLFALIIKSNNKKMKKLFLFTVLLTVLISCKNNTNQKAEAGDGFKSFVVKESIPAGGYVYILGEQGDDLKWFAASLREVNIGDVYYYDEPLLMKDFYSKELDRPFDEINFLMKISRNPEDLKEVTEMNKEMKMPSKPSGKITTDQKDISIDIPKKGISIGQLYENLKNYDGKKVLIRGEIVKFSPEIMNTNWVHIQDGTSFDGKYDLTLTTDLEVNVGDVKTFEGTVVLDKDFGYGYFYEVLIEKAKITE